MSNYASASASASSSFPVLGILGIVFITLKLMGYIAWSWWWVLAPFWVLPVTLITVFVVIWFFVWLAR